MIHDIVMSTREYYFISILFLSFQEKEKNNATQTIRLLADQRGKWVSKLINDSTLMYMYDFVYVCILVLDAALSRVA